jgi:hypothetical protein
MPSRTLDRPFSRHSSKLAEYRENELVAQRRYQHAQSTHAATAEVIQNLGDLTCQSSTNASDLRGAHEGDWVMKLKLAVAAALAVVIATPTLAAEFYVVQSSANK